MDIAGLTVRERLIVALDFPTAEQALAMVDKLPGCTFKVGKELYEVAGPQIIAEIQKRRGKVFRDGKFHDIPNTVAGAAAAATRNGCVMFNVHAEGGKKMIQSAVEAAKKTAEELGVPRPLVLAVTVLTSIDDKTMQEELGIPRTAAEEVVRRAKMAQEAGADGVVASPLEVAMIRKACGEDFVIVTPGIRPAEAGMDDQKRVATPAEAMKNGATFLVVGRPITKAPDPAAAVEAIVQEMEMGLRAREDDKELKGLALKMYELGAIKFGAFRLKLHETKPDAPLSPIYIDLRPAFRQVDFRRWVVGVLFGKMWGNIPYPDLISDVPEAATPVATTLADRLGVNMVSPQIKTKTHGAPAKVQGIFQAGQTAVLVDDLITKADSKLEAIEALVAAGLCVRDIFVVVDREQGGRDQLAKAGYTLHSIFTLSQLLDIYLAEGCIDQAKYEETKAYLAANR